MAAGEDTLLNDGQHWRDKLASRRRNTVDILNLLWRACREDEEEGKHDEGRDDRGREVERLAERDEVVDAEGDGEQACYERTTQVRLILTSDSHGLELTDQDDRRLDEVNEEGPALHGHRLQTHEAGQSARWVWCRNWKERTSMKASWRRPAGRPE